MRLLCMALGHAWGEPDLSHAPVLVAWKCARCGKIRIDLPIFDAAAALLKRLDDVRPYQVDDALSNIATSVQQVVAQFVAKVQTGQRSATP